MICKPSKKLGVTASIVAHNFPSPNFPWSVGTLRPPDGNAPLKHWSKNCLYNARHPIQRGQKARPTEQNADSLSPPSNKSASLGAPLFISGVFPHKRKSVSVVSCRCISRYRLPTIAKKLLPFLTVFTCACAIRYQNPPRASKFFSMLFWLHWRYGRFTAFKT